MPEKKSTSTPSTSVAENAPGGRDLGRASYHALQTQDTVVIFALGWHPTPGYLDFFQQSPIDVFPPEFIFHSVPPGIPVPQVLTPFAIWVMFGATDPIKNVRVHDADGAHEVPVEQVSKTLAASSQRATWVSGHVMRGGAAGIFGRATTMATGEEGGGPTTMATGEEEITAPTTMATGEEGGGPTTMATGEEETRMATTMATGEEGGGGPTTMATGEENIGVAGTFGGPPITTMAVAEEAVATTLALGEEGTTTRFSAATTLDLGEEATTTLRLAHTTLAVGEENPTTDAIGEEGPTTLAVGEENPTTEAIGEEGPTTLAIGEETTAVMRSSPFGTF